MRRILLLTVILALALALITIHGPMGAHVLAGPGPAPAQPPSGASSKLAPQVQTELRALAPAEMLTAIVTLADQADLGQIPGTDRAARLRGVIRALQAKANASQRQIVAFLQAGQAQGTVSQFASFWVFNGLSVTATGEVFQELASREDVAHITPDGISIVPDQTGGNAPEPNLSVIGAPSLWDVGLYGQGIVVANMDSGVDVSHPDLVNRWRGGTSSWYDPYGQHPITPTDLSGHGTWTMGVMVGGDVGGTSIGVAPQAQWIAVKMFNDAGSATATAIHQGFQWLLDPDGNPNTPDAPYVVNNSWTFAYPGCDLEFELDMQSLRAAGILPVFAAGNGGPSAGTSYSPANNPSAFAVGGTDNGDLLYASSSRGPSNCGEPTTIFPELVAPGVGIHTTDLSGSYTDATGTSLAAPHVAGALALLLNAYPDLSADYQAAALINGALDLGSGGPDNDYGHGRLAALAAYQWLGTAPTPTPMPTATPTPDPTVNLALNQPVTVSSAQDSGHSGAMAVDGDLATLWQTAKAAGKNKLASEWIEIDLGAAMTVGRLVLEWDAYYATSYSLQVSDDGNTWSTVFSTSSGDGANDTIVFGTAQARYVRFDSTAWNNGSLRNWLKEFQVYAGGGPAPTPTPAPTSTPNPTPTPGSGTTMHVGDLDGASAQGTRNRWDATVTILVHDASENPLANATVSGTWGQGASGSDTCVTDVDGACSVTKRNLKSSVSIASFTVDTVDHASASYAAAVNHDPDGDSDGTGISVSSP